MPTRRLWRRARQAGRAWWAPKADQPREEVLEVPGAIAAWVSSLATQVIGVEEAGERSRRTCTYEDSHSIDTTCTTNSRGLKKAEVCHVLTLVDGAPQDGEGTTAPCDRPSQDETAAYYRPVLTSARSEGARLERRIAELEADCQQMQILLVQTQAAWAALEDLLERERTKTAALEIENSALRERINHLLLQPFGTNITSDGATSHLNALSRLLLSGAEAGPLNFGEMVEMWQPGLLRAIHMKRLRGACTCAQEIAANGLSKGLERFEDLRLLGRGSFGVVHAGVCTVTKKRVAIKTALAGSNPTFVLRELMAYAILGQHENIIDVSCLSDFAGSQGLVMEAALCDLRSAVVGASQVTFSLAQIISLEADATAGLAYMHDCDMVHVDHKMENTLVCTSPDSPWGFVGKIADPGLCCGIGELKYARMGTISHAPPEALKAEVPASPLDDTFAVGVDLSFMLVNPDLRMGNMWAHQILQTTDEKETLACLQSEGGNMYEFMVGLTHRTMTDGSFARIILQPFNLNPDLPLGELENVCAFIRNAVSATPTDRQPMATVSAFLRALAISTAARWAQSSTTLGVDYEHDGVVAEGDPAVLEEELQEKPEEHLVRPSCFPSFERGGDEAEADGGEDAAASAVVPLAEAPAADMWRPEFGFLDPGTTTWADAPTVPVVFGPRPEEFDGGTVAVSSDREVGPVVEILARGFVSWAGTLGAPIAINSHIEVSSGGAAAEAGGGVTALDILARGFRSEADNLAGHVDVNLRAEGSGRVATPVLGGSEAAPALDILDRGFATGADTLAPPLHLDLAPGSGKWYGCSGDQWLRDGTCPGNPGARLCERG